MLEVMLLGLRGFVAFHCEATPVKIQQVFYSGTSSSQLGISGNSNALKLSSEKVI